MLTTLFQIPFAPTREKDIPVNMSEMETILINFYLHTDFFEEVTMKDGHFGRFGGNMPMLRFEDDMGFIQTETIRRVSLEQGMFTDPNGNLHLEEYSEQPREDSTSDRGKILTRTGFLIMYPTEAVGRAHFDPSKDVERNYSVPRELLEGVLQPTD